ncbi:MAG: exo-alpha-sialidase [Acidobacteriota bacterium]
MGRADAAGRSRRLEWKSQGRGGWMALLAVVLLLAASRLAAATSQAPQIVSRSTVFAHPAADPYDRTNRHGFNHAPSVVGLPDGRLMAAWFSGPFEASVHQAILASFSSDGGVNWTPARVLQDVPRESDFDPAFIADGPRIWFFYTAGRHNRYPVMRDRQGVGVQSFKLFARYSDDSARSWSGPRLIGRGVFCRSNGIRLSTGELLLPLYEIPSRASVLRSGDRGATWTRHGEIVTPAGAGEPSLAELGSGRVLMVLRTNDGFLWKVYSKDRGQTWDQPVKTPLPAPGSSHCLFSVPSGLLVLAHNDSPSVRTPLTLRISTDGGETWQPPVMLGETAVPRSDEEVWSREVSYPGVTLNSRGQLVVVWANLTVSDTEQYGDIESAVLEIAPGHGAGRKP